MALCVPQAPVHGHGLVPFSTMSPVKAPELGGGPLAPPGWQGGDPFPGVRFLGDSSLGRGEGCLPREGKGAVRFCGSCSQCGVGPPPIPGFWRLKASCRFPKTQLGLSVQAPSPSHSCFPLHSWDPLPDCGGQWGPQGQTRVSMWGTLAKQSPPTHVTERETEAEACRPCSGGKD